MASMTCCLRSAALAIGDAIGGTVHSRQIDLPRCWLIADERLGEELWDAVAGLPRGSGVLLLLHGMPRRERHAILRKLRLRARARGLIMVDEAARAAARVHDARELRQALLGRAWLILLSPIYPTRSHPDWRPIPRMRAAALARLASRRLVALGGMNARRFRRVERLGFCGWAAIDGLRT
jgi:thiamine-phosphate pyrophosphorylase